MDIIQRSKDMQDKVEARARRFGKGKYGRVLKMARKPTNEEFTKTLQITAVGIILIGALGFLIYLIWNIWGPDFIHWLGG